MCRSLLWRSISSMPELWRSTSGPYRDHGHEGLPLCSTGTPISAPVSTNRRVHYCRPRPRLGPFLSLRGTPLPHLPRRELSIPLLGKRTAPRSPHPRLVCPAALADPALGDGRLRLSPAFSARHSGGACLDCTDSRPGPPYPPRGYSAHSATSAPPVDGRAGSINPAGVAPP